MSLITWVLLFISVVASIVAARAYARMKRAQRLLDAEPTGDDLLAASITRLLASDPAGWKSDNYTISHTSGLSVWIANEDYGIKVSERRDRLSSGYGSLTDYKPATRAQHAIWTGYLRWRAEGALALRTKADAAFDRRIAAELRP